MPQAYGQLCWTNASLVEHIIANVKEFLKIQPQAYVISVSQNDNGNYCKDPAELAVIDEEGSPIGMYPCVPFTAAISIVHADAILTLALFS